MNEILKGDRKATRVLRNDESFVIVLNVRIERQEAYDARVKSGGEIKTQRRYRIVPDVAEKFFQSYDAHTGTAYTISDPDLAKSWKTARGVFAALDKLRARPWYNEKAHQAKVVKMVHRSTIEFVQIIEDKDLLHRDDLAACATS